MQAELPFEDRPTTKVGTIGEEIVKAHLLRKGYRISPPPDVAANGASRVDFLGITPSGNQELIEVKTYRHLSLDGSNVFSMEKSKYEAYKRYSAAKNIPLVFYFVDAKDAFVEGSKRKPRICIASLSLMKQWEKHFTEDTFDGKTYIYFNANIPLHERCLTDAETQRLVAAIREMDAANAAASEMPTLHESNESETSAENSMPQIVKADVQEVNYKLKPFVKTCPLVFYQTSDGQILCLVSNIFFNMTQVRRTYSTSGHGDSFKRVIESVCKEIYSILKNPHNSRRFWALKVKDVEAIILGCLEVAPKRHTASIKNFFEYWRESVLPAISNGATIKRTPKTKKTKKSSDTPKPIVTTESAVDINTTLREILQYARRFKGYGINGQSVITAIKFVEDERHIELSAVEEFANYLQSEYHEPEGFSKEEFYDIQ